MFAVASLLIVLALSLLIVRIATVALTMTGLSKQAAQFQARSAYTGTGFTTAESEKVVNHPVRRRIIMLLMLIRNGGIVTIVGTLILSFVGIEEQWRGLERFLLLLIGLAVLWLVATSRWLTSRMEGVIGWSLRRFTRLDTRDYGALLHLTGDYRVVELTVEPQDWLAAKPLRELRLNDEGVLVLGIQRPDGSFTGAPDGDTAAHPGDTLILYGRAARIDELDERRNDHRGHFAHMDAVAEARADRQRDEQPTQPTGG